MEEVREEVQETKDEWEDEEVKEVINAMELKGIEQSQIDAREQNREKMKNQRISQQSSEQSKLIDQRKNNLPPINFESNEDSLDGFDMAEFNPR